MLSWVIMGASLYWYVVPYEPDINSALQKLRAREFQAGRYNPVVPFPEFPVGPETPAPGAGHASYEEAFSEADADGTRSILDLQGVSPEPAFSPWPDMMAHPVPGSVLTALFGTATPDKEAILNSHDFLDKISRGSGVYVVLEKDGQPHEIFFAGYSAD
jgi:hypothetical protein